MKIGIGAAVAVIGLFILVAGGRRSRGALVAACVTFAFAGYFVVSGIKSWRIEKKALAFIAAAERGDLAVVRRMADEEPLLVNASQTIGGSVKLPLTSAAKELHADVVEFLLSRGAMADAQTDDGSTALHEAGAKYAAGDEKVSAQRIATLQALLGHAANVDAKDDRGGTPLMANARDPKAVALLIRAHANVKAHDSSGETPLHYAVGSSRDHSASVAILLDHGADVNARDRNGETPLLKAANAGDLETLIARGADPTVTDTNGQTALHRIARSPNNALKDLDALAVLCACGVRADARDRTGATPLALARVELARETDKTWIAGRQRIVKFLSPGGPCAKLAGATKEQREFVVAGLRCDEADRYGCAVLAWDYDTGTGTVADQSRAAALYEKACGLGSMQSCTNLAYDYNHGEGVAEDPPRAVALYEKACDGGDMKACLNLGLLIDNGRGAPKDHPRAAALFRRACDAGENEACERAGG